MIARMIRIALVLLLALGGGTALTWVTIRGGDRFGAVQIGGWTAYPEAGTPAADPYAKARLARDASLSLGAAEGVTFFSNHDSDGTPLSASCDYVLTGIAPPTRFWTLYPVGANQLQLLPANPELPASLHSGRLLYGEDGNFDIHISTQAKPDNWLAIPQAKTFTLAFTLYDSPVATNKGLIETDFPQIQKERCRG